MKYLLVAIVFAISVNAGTNIYSATISASNHHAFCGRINDVINGVENAIPVFFVPPKGQTLTAAQFTEIQALEASADGQMDAARC